MDQPLPVDEANSQAWAAVAYGTRTISHVLQSIGSPSPASNLQQVDDLYPFEKASDWHRSYLFAALEHLAVWADSVAPLKFHPEHRVLHTFRPAYTLARAAIEASSQAVWLTAGGTARECARRHLSLVRWDLAEQRKSAFSPEAKQVLKERDATLVQRAAAAFAEDELRPPNQVEVLRAAAPVVDLEADHLVAIWRAASGAAHGRVWPSLALQHVIPLVEYEPGQFHTFRVPDAAKMTEALQVAELITTQGVLRHADFCGADIPRLLEEARLWLLSVVPLREDADPQVVSFLSRREHT